MILQDFRSLAHGFLGIDRTIGVDLENEFVKVGTLLEAGTVDLIGHAAHRTERGIKLQATDRTRFLIRKSARHSRLIADATRNLKTHIERNILGQMADHMLRIDYLDRMIDRDVSRRHYALALLAQGQRGLVGSMHADRYILDVEQDFNDVLLQTLKRGVLMQDVVDFNFDNRAAGN